MPRNLNLEKTMGELGWEPWNSGGGCMTYRKEKEQGEGYLLITDFGGCDMPTSITEKVLMGGYDDADIDDIPAEEFPTLRDCILLVEEVDIAMACIGCGTTVGVGDTHEGYLCDMCYDQSQTEEGI